METHLLLKSVLFKRFAQGKGVANFGCAANLLYQTDRVSNGEASSISKTLSLLGVLCIKPNGDISKYM